MAIGLRDFKLLACAILFSMGAFGLLPSRAQRIDKSGRLLSCCGMFSGGIFLGGGLLHLLPESVDALKEYVKQTLPSYSDFPLAFVLCGTGFFAVLAVEQMAIAYKRALTKPQTNIELEERLGMSSPLTGSCDAHDDEIEISLESHESGGHDGSACGEGLARLKQRLATHRTRPYDRITDVPASNQAACNDHDTDCHSLPSASQSGSATVFVLVLALSFHGVFEGIALGTQVSADDTLSNDALSVFISIAAHGPLAAFALGISLVRSGSSTCTRFGCLLVFSLANPIGIAVGWLLSDETDPAIGGCFQALSAGTFLYVAIMEIFAHELHQPRDVFLKLVLGFVGFAVMGAIKVLLDAD